MFGIGLPEILIVLLVALVVVGPAKLPEIAKSLGRGLNELKKVMSGAEESMKQAMYDEDIYSPSVRKDEAFKEENTKNEEKTEAKDLNREGNEKKS
ncbi:MAG: twin-arginine translocase TatA/TatE family subunit [Nitrospinae bacterium]|nr:twin-arginine translocase TatA/TatE family subunit [Nitrospinota bacterium]